MKPQNKQFGFWSFFHPSSFILHPSLLALLICAAPCLLPTAHASEEAFVAPSFRIGTLEMQTEASVYDSAVTLKQICRWGHDDNAVFQPVADLVLAHLDGQKFVSIKADDVLNILQGAGISPAAIRFTGAVACTVSRVDTPIDHAAAFAEWSQATEKSKAASQPTSPPTGLAASAVSSSSPTPLTIPDNGVRSLRDTLIRDLANRLQMSVDTLQVDFDPRDEKLLSMTNPPFVFELAPNRFHNLGNVSWDLTIRAGRSVQSAHIAALARAWQNQVVTTDSVEFNQVLRPGDLTEQRVLVDTVSDEPLLTLKQAVGQQAAMNLKIGAVLTARKVTSPPMIRDGQLVTVNVGQGGVNVQTEARALESATYGQSVRLRNESTHDVFQATVTGPQQVEMK